MNQSQGLNGFDLDAIDEKLRVLTEYIQERDSTECRVQMASSEKPAKSICGEVTVNW